MHRLIAAALVTLAVGVFSTPARANTITGGIGFSGVVDPIGGPVPNGGFDTSTELDFLSASILNGTQEGAYAGVSGATVVTFNNLVYDPFPVGGVTPLWTFVSAGNTYSFDLTSLTVTERTATDLVLRGVGTLTISGGLYTPTTGAFSLSADTSNNVTFVFSSTVSAVPDSGATLALLGLGLLGLGYVRQRLA